MSTPSTPRRSSLSGLAAILGIGVVLGVGIPYVVTQLSSDEKPVAKKATPPPPAPAPPKLEFLGVGSVSGDTVTLKDASATETAHLNPDDAMIVWLKNETARSGSGGASGRGGGGGRGGPIALSVKDSAGQDYSYSMERKGSGILALHLKRGYDKKPDSLTISQNSGDKAIASWKVDKVPSPTQVLPDPAAADPMGEIQLAEGRGGRLTASIHLNAPLSKTQCLILHPVSATYAPIDTARDPRGLVAKAGESTFAGNFSLPNAPMERYVAFDMQTYEAVVTTETVSCKPAHLELKFGKPTLVVDANMDDTSLPSNIRLQVPAQDDGPKRQLRKIRQEASLKVKLDSSDIKTPSKVEGLAPTVDTELLSPTATELGLEKINLSTIMVLKPEGDPVFGLPTAHAALGSGGTPKVGPTSPIKLQFTIMSPKLISTRRVIFAVNHNVAKAVGMGMPGGK